MVYARSIFGTAVFMLTAMGLSIEAAFVGPLDVFTAEVKAERVALVIGNAAYDNPYSLHKSVNDADSMAAALKDCGFTVLKHTDLNRNEMGNAVLAFSDSIKQGGVGLFYYSGHSVEVDGENYLVPVDFKTNKNISLENLLKIQGLSMNLVLEMMTDAGSGVNILILDSDMAAMNAPVGTLIAYAASPDQHALETLHGSNSHFTGALLEVMREPGLRIEDVFRKVQIKVIDDTEGSQVPWTSSSLQGDFYFVLPSEKDLNADQAFELGQMYYHVDENKGEAAEWFRKAAERGHLKAQYSLGEMYYYGYGVDENNEEAVKWFRKAAEQGDDDAQSYLRRIEAENRVAVGREAPDFTLQTLDGKRFNLTEHRGRPVFLNFWATWCTPCREEMPDMKKLQQTLGDSILIVGIDMGESADTVREFVKDNGYAWTFVLDSEGEASQTYNVSSIPMSVFIDAKGMIVRRFGEKLNYETFLAAARQAISN